MEYELRDKRTWVKGILVDCPAGTPVEDCPARAMRSLTLPQLVSIVNGMSEKKLDAIMAHHQNCLREREAASE
jgi:hypothetical protein